MKLSVKQTNLLSNVLVSISMTIVMTGGMLFLHSGYSNIFFELWVNDFLLGCSIAIPTGLIIAPMITKSISQLTKN